MLKLPLTLVQLAIQDGDPGSNHGRAEALIRAAPKSMVYLLPELWTTGYQHGCWSDAADRHTPEIARRMARLAEDLRAWIGGSMVTRNVAGRLVNRFWLFGPTRDRVIYDKAHLFAPMQEDRLLVAGDWRVRTQVGEFQTALSICFDLRFPEQYRLDAVSGAELFLVVAEWPAARAEAMHLFARARAAENQAFLALCNRAGMGRDGTVFGGGSLVTSPTGEVLAEGGDAEQVVHVVLDREQVRLARSTLEVLGARRSGVDHD